MKKKKTQHLKGSFSPQRGKNPNGQTSAFFTKCKPCFAASRRGSGARAGCVGGCEAGEGTWRVCICIAGAQKCEERESMGIIGLDV